MEFTHATVKIVDGVRRLIIDETRGIRGELVFAKGVMPDADDGKVIKITFETDQPDLLPSERGVT